MVAKGRRGLTHFSSTPSNTMVRKMLNLRSTVNMGKLGDKSLSF